MPGLTGLCGLSGLSGRHGGPYHEKILDYNPIALFPLWEAAGVQADEIANAWNGAHTGVTLGQPGLGDGYTCPFYDGINDFTNIWTAALAAAFSGTELSILIWVKVANVGVWTDGSQHVCIILQVDNNNKIKIAKSAANNTLTYQRVGGGVTETINQGGYTTTDWLMLGATVSETADIVRFYVQGAQVGSSGTLGAWVGALNNSHTVIGNESTWPENPCFGWLAYGAILDYPLTPGDMAELGRLVGGVL